MRLNKARVGQVVGADFGREMLEASDRAQAGNPASEQVWQLLLSEVEPDPNQPRRHFDETSLRELAEDIEIRGVLEPILVRQVEEHYQIIVGERRWRASKLAGKARIPCIVREMSAEDIREAQLVENILRQDINDIERGLALRNLYESLKATDKEITWEKVAARVGLTRMRIHNLYSLSLLPPVIIEMIQSRRLSGSHGVELSRLSEHPEVMIGIAESACRLEGSKGAYALSVAQVREHVNQALNQVTEKPKRRIPAERIEQRALELVSSLRPNLPTATREVLRRQAQMILSFLGEADHQPEDNPDESVKLTLQSQPDSNRKGAPR